MRPTAAMKNLLRTLEESTKVMEESHKAQTKDLLQTIEALSLNVEALRKQLEEAQRELRDAAKRRDAQHEMVADLRDRLRVSHSFIRGVLKDLPL